jgi:hypothetical protein
MSLGRRRGGGREIRSRVRGTNFSSHALLGGHARRGWVPVPTGSLSVASGGAGARFSRETVLQRAGHWSAPAAARASGAEIGQWRNKRWRSSAMAITAAATPTKRSIESSISFSFDDHPRLGALHPLEALLPSKRSERLDTSILVPARTRVHRGSSNIKQNCTRLAAVINRRQTRWRRRRGAEARRSGGRGWRQANDERQEGSSH